MRTTCPVFPPVCYAAKRNPWFAQNIHATNFLCSIELICLICWLKIVMIRTYAQALHLVKANAICPYI
ncbi:MAG: hypothetical protein MGU50_23695 [Trichodesmium sp. MAG_R02]|nr:hypothetical protein [Trichodesmium sp. MAG_R02]